MSDDHGTMVGRATVTVRVLGPIAAEANGCSVALGGPRQRALLAHLTACDAPARGAVLAEEIWGDPSATDSVKTAISRLRRVLGSELVCHLAGGYVLDRALLTTDAQTFECHLRRARAEDAPPAGRVDDYRAALACWRGAAYSDCESDACRSEASRLAELRLAASGELIGLRLDRGEAIDVVPELEALVAEHPWRESFTEQLMVALYRSRRQRDALAAYRHLERKLIDELGVRPNPRAQALHLAIIEHDDDRVRLEPMSYVGHDRASDGRTWSRSAEVVGRAAELERLRAAVDRSRIDGRARVVVVAGPAGIGKTTLVERFAGMVDDGVVVRATGIQSDPVAFFTVGAVVDGLVASVEAAQASTADLADLELVTASLVPTDGSSQAVIDRDLRRLRLQRAIERLFDAVLGTAPLVLVIDDLHWVDRSSLAVLGRLVPKLADRPLTLVVSCRTSEMAERGPVSDFISAACGQLPSSTIELGGLDEASVAQMIAARGDALDQDHAGDLRREVLAATQGHPFFIVEWLRHRAAERDGATPQPPPATVQATITERIDRLPEETVEVLSHAAVLGPRFTEDQLVRLGDAPLAEVVHLLGGATGVGLIVPATPPGAYGFSHALVRQVLLERLPTHERAGRHAAVAELASGDLSVMELADHLCRAVPLVSTERAAQAAIGAGDQAMGAAAFEDAARWYERALGVLDAFADDRLLRANALVGLGNALATGPDSAEPRELLEAAMKIAADHRAGVLYARALLGRAQFGVSHEHRDAEVERAREVLDLLDDHDDFLRVRVLLWAVWQLLYGVDHDLAEPFLAEAAGLAERLGESNSIGAVLQARHALLVAQVAPLDQRRAIRRRIASLPADRTRYEGSLIGGASVFDDLIEEGDLGVLRAQLERFRRDADEIGRPYERWSARAIRFTVEMWSGDLDAAETAMREADALGQSLQIEVSRSAAAGQLLLLSWERSQLATAVPLLEALVEATSAPEPWLPPLALAYLEAGRVDDACRVAVDLPDAIQSTVHRQNRAATASVAAEIVDAVRDDRLTATVETVLTPYSGRLRVSPTGVFTLGPYDRFLGMCALARNDLDTAVRRLDAARLLSQKYGLAVWEPRSAVWQAEALLRRDRPDDRLLAQTLVDGAARAGQTIGSALLGRLVTDLRTRHGLPD